MEKQILERRSVIETVLPQSMFHGEEENEKGHPRCCFEDEELCHESIHLVVNVVVTKAARYYLVNGLALIYSKNTCMNLW